ncbi:MC117 [Molluscum contagiosum virus subtype 2]|uniref:MC117 n=2 Tax=Molluscum contagiosum virus TaxID=10279 RepID=A0A1S7DLV3_MCV2|nr:MC117 [Molluscum contagiosum virus subtype 2]QHW16505.1 MC117L [Molluscum contagiosum virus]AYO87752.1 MC117 [Molluscum contagiosum virus subtype 2]AYO87922.1 MC117 [Molluscum contagiosum virus subtype 2]AYO88092.1 MC117 [Molluscum contagiosum virus subtype 2]
MMLTDAAMLLICVAIVALLLYAVYRRGRETQTTPKRTVDELVENDAIFRDDLTPDQIRALHRFFTGAS